MERKPKIAAASREGICIRITALARRLLSIRSVRPPSTEMPANLCSQISLIFTYTFIPRLPLSVHSASSLKISGWRRGYSSLLQSAIRGSTHLFPSAILKFAAVAACRRLAITFQEMLYNGRLRGYFECSDQGCEALRTVAAAMISPGDVYLA